MASRLTRALERVRDQLGRATSNADARQGVRDGAGLQRTTVAEEARRQHEAGLIDERTMLDAQQRLGAHDVPVVGVDGVDGWARTYPVDAVDQERTSPSQEVSLDELAQIIADDQEATSHPASVQAVRDGADLQRTTIAEEAHRQHAAGLIDDRTRRAAQQETDADDPCEARHARAWQRDYDAAQRTGRPPEWAAEYADETRAEYHSGLADDRDRQAGVQGDRDRQADLDDPRPSRNREDRDQIVPQKGQTATPRVVTPELVAEAREWVAECQWKEDPELIEEYSDAEIVRGVERHYDGGWDGFVHTTGQGVENARHPAVAEANPSTPADLARDTDAQMRLTEPEVDEPNPHVVDEARLDAIAERLADRVTIEARETDPSLAALQDARDWSAARGDFDLADSQDRILGMLRAPAREPDVPQVDVPEQREPDRQIGD